ncbi:hypothetical protein C8N24_0721 [Solirubrobacter pauli]|uniref:Uncharacterized protein n=2 Tax=Solirubrobacter pauli TaxID=166793 RepID=A0A660L947_9ACTN|nr:hypothetical protein C8N24_0721 [Solirubrobacter pauli]
MNLKWQPELNDLCGHLIAGHGISFNVTLHRTLRSKPAVDLILTPVRDLAGVHPRSGDEHSWLVWQSHTGRGVLTALPCHPGQLADQLGLAGQTNEARLVQAALSALMDGVHAPGRL